MESTTPPSDDCGEVPNVALVSGDVSVTMDLVFYEESTGTCGYNADGEAMFDDSYRPASVLLAEGGQSVGRREALLASSPSTSVHSSPGLRLASIEPSADALASSADGGYVLSLRGAGCFVVTVGFRGEARDGRFTGLAESEIDVCGVMPSSSECRTDQDRSDTMANAVVDWVDFVRLAGRLYDHSSTSNLEPGALGNVVGRVCFTLAGVVSTRRIDSWTAMPPSCRSGPSSTRSKAPTPVCVWQRSWTGRSGLQVSMVEGASTGGELIDLTSPITEFRVNPTSGGEPLGTIVDAELIVFRLLELLFRIAPLARSSTPVRNRARRTLSSSFAADGTATAWTFVVETAMMWPGIALPTQWVEAVQQAVGEVRVVAVHDDFSFYGPCGNDSVDVFGTTYYQLYTDEFEALDESRYPNVEDDPNAPSRLRQGGGAGPRRRHRHADRVQRRHGPLRVRQRHRRVAHHRRAQLQLGLLTGPDSCPVATHHDDTRRTCSPATTNPPRARSAPVGGHLKLPLAATGCPRRPLRGVHANGPSDADLTSRCRGGFSRFVVTAPRTQGWGLVTKARFGRHDAVR